ncbi:MAG: DUF4382 domain-containing protein [Ignavibacteriales bacterium]|nr:DUF4382 domain-containing protein [Ignavibacteriales bacterium]
MNGTTSPLVVSSGFQTGVKLNHQFRIEEGTLYELTLDFDAARSIRQVDNQYFLTPVIRIQANVTSGNISGNVLPVAANASVWTTVGLDTVKSMPDTSGAFKLVALPDGTYAVRFSPVNTAYRDSTVSGVAVTKQQTTNMGTFTLSTQ